MESRNSHNDFVTWKSTQDARVFVDVKAKSIITAISVTSRDAKGITIFASVDSHVHIPEMSVIAMAPRLLDFRSAQCRLMISNFTVFTC
jgi:hypothetical protein